MGFALMFLIGFFIPVANILIDIGAVMGERLFFHASFGLSLFVSMLIFYFLNKLSSDSVRKFKPFFLSILFLIMVTFSYFSYSRNFDWKNNTTLFLSDVKKAPNNINVVTGAGTAFYELSLLPENDSIKKVTYAKYADSCFTKGIKIHYTYFPAHLNKSINLLTLGKLDSSLKYAENVLKMIPESRGALNVKNIISEQYMLRGEKRFTKGNEEIALNDFDSAIIVNMQNFVAWNNLGKAFVQLSATCDSDSIKSKYTYKADSCFSKAISVKIDYFPAYLNKSKNLLANNALDSSLKYIASALKLIPENPDAIAVKNAISNQFMLDGIKSLKENDFRSGLQYLTKSLNANKQNIQAWNVMGKALEASGAIDKALLCYRAVLKLNPENNIALQGVNSIDSLKKIGVGKGTNQ